MSQPIFYVKDNSSVLVQAPFLTDTNGTPNNGSKL